MNKVSVKNWTRYSWIRYSGVAIAAGIMAVACSVPTPPIITESPGVPAATNAQGVAIAPAEETITIDGSSTVYPITDEVVKEYAFEREDEPEIKVEFSGTSGGFRKFCAGETDISNASRPITRSEMAACKSAGVRYYELPVAFDALTVAVHRDNTWVDALTVAELKKIWEPSAEGRITRWNQVRPSFPDRPLELYGAGSDSGTFDYFTEAIVGRSGASRKDYNASEDDYDLVRGVRNNPDALGYFGLAYFEESRMLLRPVPIDNGAGAVLPSADTVREGLYQPLARPLFIYVNADSAAKNPKLKSFVEFYLNNGRFLSKVVGYVPLPDEVYNIALTHFQTGKVGTVFGGEAPTNLKLEDLLQKEAAF
ncbi:MAG: PstS family phosphate ABC transporter substrate-binding protein [Cyanobacteria bacterium J069]|nr:MAG: PstS family phosphate ABC transporter substrate-binding protein [Cyanobacteria bacterium J069]